jgi:hypothetical protein
MDDAKGPSCEGERAVAGFIWVATTLAWVVATHTHTHREKNRDTDRDRQPNKLTR